MQPKTTNVVSYRRASQPSLGITKTFQDLDRSQRNLHLFMGDELRKIETSIATLVKQVPQVALSEPQDRIEGMIRYAKSPWNPLGTGDAWVWWNGSEWTSF
jgi:hypothetical protein